MTMTGTSGKKNPEPSNSTENLTVVLYDSRMDDKQLLNLMNQNSKLVIITFDYESHKFLSKKNVSHLISDMYLPETDIPKIQEASYSLSRWFEEDNPSSFIEYEGINLGKLYQVEFHYHLIPFIKRFVEFTNMYKEYKNAKFLAAGTLFDIAQSFTSNVFKYQNIEKSSEFLYDSIKIPFKIGSKTIEMNISRKNYLRFKGLVEMFTRRFVQTEPISGKSILLVEFDPVKYEKILDRKSTKNLNFIFSNRRRPAIWNKQSFEIIKRSKSYVITHSEIKNGTQSKIEENSVMMEKRIESMMDDLFFQSFFSIFEHSFWKPIKPIFFNLAKKRIQEAIYEIELAKTVFKKYSFSAVLVLSEIGFHEQIMIKMAKKMKIPVILVQHGLYYDTQKAFSFNNFAGIFPFDSDKFIAWGKIMEKYAIDCGISDNKIMALGSPSLDGHFDQSAHVSDMSEDYVLLATSSPTNNFVSDLTMQTREQYEESIKIICKVVRKMNKKLIIKLHPFSEEMNISGMINEIDPTIQIIKNADFVSLVKSCQIFVTIDMSTTILEAQIFQKPVITLTVKNYGFGDPEVLRTNSCISTNMDNFEKVLMKVMEDPAYKKNITKNGTNFLNNYISNQGKASEKISEFLESM
jgi:hypothetical protein